MYDSPKKKESVVYHLKKIMALSPFVLVCLQKAYGRIGRIDVHCVLGSPNGPLVCALLPWIVYRKFGSSPCEYVDTRYVKLSFELIYLVQYVM